MTETDILYVAYFAAKRFKGSDIHEGLVQEACLHLIETRPNPEEAAKKARWHVGHVINKEKRNREKVLAYGSSRPDRYEDPILTRMIFREAMETLTANRRDIIRRYFWLSQTASEIAKETGREVRTIVKKRGEAIKALEGPLSGMI